VFNIVCTPITHPDMKGAQDNPLSEMAFLCNLQSHWFAIRKVGDEYWDLNSLHKQPSFLGELYLGAFLKQLQIDGYSIFVTRGDFPRVVRGLNDPNWTLCHHQPTRGGVPRGQNNDDTALSAAIAESLKDTPQWTEEESLMAAIQASLQDPSTPQTFPSPPPAFQSPNDTDLEAAILLSMQSPSSVPNSHPVIPESAGKKIPPEPEGDSDNIAKIIIRLPNGSRVERRFDVHNSLGDVFTWLDIHFNIDPGSGRFVLTSQFPRKEYKELDKTLQELGLVGSTLLTVSDCK